MGEWYDPYFDSSDTNWYEIDTSSTSSWWEVGSDGEHKSVYHEDIRLHFLIRAFREEGGQKILIDEISTKSFPERFQYRSGGSWNSFPSQGLGPAHHGAQVRGKIPIGNQTKIFVQLAVEPRISITEENIDDSWWVI